MKKKVIIYVPGLQDHRYANKQLTKFLSKLWGKFGYEFITIQPNWYTGNFEEKLRLITDTIDYQAKKDTTIILIGQSAGASAVLNAFSQRKAAVSKVINVCGRLREGKNVFPSLKLAAHGIQAFEESVLLFENNHEKTLNNIDRKKVLIIRPFFDEIVPKSTNSLQGAINVTVPMIFHSLGGLSAMTIFSQKIRNFIEE